MPSRTQALAEIWRWLVAAKFAAGLLHGVTGSGKTEVYLGAIEAALSRGKTAIVLVPEIALTLGSAAWSAPASAQPSLCFTAAFRISNARANGGASATATRASWSARVPPFSRRSKISASSSSTKSRNPSYKQEETPRYNGRDTAVYRARIEGAVALLGSATPSLETYHNARAGKYHLLELTRRVANRPLAEVRVIDLARGFSPPASKPRPSPNRCEPPSRCASRKTRRPWS